ncbi:methyltransferase-like protein 24 isoform X1 [Callorhinchus milii]|nr:methyltransferase-like protein 24 isoform X1 [Callorhinchus milii]|eukprot:gi/632953026/ref/XP_007892171.1/ PREDICTED: methyltransferase-like protein 24 [Callorhinchus milii]
MWAVWRWQLVRGSGKAEPEPRTGTRAAGGEAREPGSWKKADFGRKQVTYVRSLKRDRTPQQQQQQQQEEQEGEGCCHIPPQHSKPKFVRWHIDLQSWAGPTHSLEEEAARFLAYISNTQISCANVNEKDLSSDQELTMERWPICLDDRFGLSRQMLRGRCRIYSLGLEIEDKHFEEGLAKAGCEVHCFDPSIKEPHIQQSNGLWHHRVSVDWRDPNPAIAAQKHYRTIKKLGTIMNDYQHQKIDLLKLDMESAEWKILENLILENVIDQIGQLMFVIHLHWPGFEVGGDDSSVVRYWYSLLKELELKNFKLFHSHKNLNKPQIFLQKRVFNASSSYTLSWVNTLWR